MAYRWKCQFNENAELPAFASVLPEADHNEVVGWEAARELGRFSYVSLEDPAAHSRNALRAGLTADIAGSGAAPVVRVTARGDVSGRAAHVARAARRPRHDLLRGAARSRSREHLTLDGLKSALSAAA